MKIEIKQRKGDGGKIEFIKIGNTYFSEGAVAQIRKGI